MVDYIREVIQEAGEWLWEWADIPGLIFGLIIVGVSLFISWWRQREQEFTEKRKLAKDTLIYSVLGTVLFCVIVLLFYAPYLAWKEEHDKRVALEAQEVEKNKVISTNKQQLREKDTYIEILREQTGRRGRTS